MFKIFDCLADQQSNGHEIPDKLGQESPDKFDFLRKLSSWTIIFLAGWLGFQGPPYLAFGWKAFESCQIQGSLDSWEDKWECRLHCCSQTQIIQKLQISLKVEDCFSWTKRRSKHQILQSGQRESWKLWKLASLFSVLGPWSWILKMQSKCVLLHPHPFLPIFRTMINQFTWYLSAWNSWDSTD